MAFNFNWSPLAADTSFYTRAQDLLTAALNKSPKPPIIVDDILVHELNLGSVPPDLEILEIGDLAEDRFRGIFKMRYSGDAFLTLKTRVQANPLNTYLSTRPSFGSPEPLAAASGLTIPLKITLSEIKLSAFIILVFSKQKGLTLVFRNDPLESLKVSSTFDSISFVRDYLQKEIEGQLRTLLMDEVPAIIHRLSLRLFVPEYREKEDKELVGDPENNGQEEAVTDPLASPPQDPVDLNGHVLDATQIASLSLDSSAETHSLFSQKNLLRLAALNDSNRTLSLFSPGMRDVMFRVWAGQMERADTTGIHSPLRASLSRTHSQVASHGTTYSFSGTASDAGSQSTRPSMASHASSIGMSSLGKHTKPGRKRKNRIVNLRKPKTKVSNEDGESVSGESSMSATLSSTTSDSGYPYPTPLAEERDAELITPPPSPHQTRLRGSHHSPETADELARSPQKLSDITPRQPPRDKQRDVTVRPLPQFAPLFEAGPSSDNQDMISPKDTTKAKAIFQPSLQQQQQERLEDSSATIRPVRPRPSRFFKSWQPPTDTSSPASTTAGPASITSPRLAAPFPYAESSPGGILEQAWMMKMAGEIARRVEGQKRAEGGFWEGNRDGGRPTERTGTPPPAYVS